MVNFGKSVNTVVIPDLTESVILDSINKAESEFRYKQNDQMYESLDFYYNRDLDKYLEEWFASDSLKQVPPFPQAIVSRFARARMMLYKNPPERLISGEHDTEYNELAYRLDSKTREFAELAWLLGCCYFKTKYNERKQRLEYEVLPDVKEYIIKGETEPIGYSYEVESYHKNLREYVFWSEDRDGVPGMHFRFNSQGKRIAIEGNPEMINPYGINPISKVKFNNSSYDVTRAALHISIAMTNLALHLRFSLGQAVFTGVEDGQSHLRSGIDHALLIPEGATFNYATPGGDMMAHIEAAKTFANQTAENNHLRIRWGDSAGNAPSGEALRIMEIENLESRESDIPIFKEWEKSRYEIDRVVLETHNVITLSDDYYIDFGEVEYPLSPAEERAWLDWKLEKGIMTKKELLYYFNPDMDDNELQEKLNEVAEEKRIEKEATQPAQPAFEGLRKLGEIN